ncbi:mitogen-activated protein kinase kinase kinase 9 [Trichinella spiralis]|uniref:mitogen-activated protein kinase kinase kinase 9 n=1 Tax=Trichinella spiralis TaxID=6334 RepID=UPI0001EFDB16|nr:mitogen-activated protein kinase kinase kinase 9 [Trichinella spiralis]
MKNKEEVIGAGGFGKGYKPDKWSREAARIDAEDDIDQILETVRQEAQLFHLFEASERGRAARRLLIPAKFVLGARILCRWTVEPRPQQLESLSRSADRLGNPSCPRHALLARRSSRLACSSRPQKQQW